MRCPLGTRTLVALAAAFGSCTLSSSLSQSEARACAPAPRGGDYVRITDEQAIVVWEPATKTEHFIRRAGFFTRSGGAGAASPKDFGFLVPTPSKPTLAEAPDAVFNALDQAIRPELKIETEDEPEFGVSCLMVFGGRSAKDTATPPQAVRMIDQQRVSGFLAVVLEADSASALATWLEENGYDSSPTLEKWLAPYVKAHWKITAFKIAPGATINPKVATSSVRMTFSTDKPFYPYREPEDQRTGEVPKGSRGLDVWLVSSEGRMDGSLGAWHAPWPGQLKYARPRQDLGTLLGGAVPAGTNLGQAWLHAFQDPSSPRQGTDDLFFMVSDVQSEIVPKPLTLIRKRPIPIPVDLVILALALAGLGIRFVWRKYY
jgi:hypothetical protein